MMKFAVGQIQVRKNFYRPTAVRQRPSNIVGDPAKAADGERPAGGTERAGVVDLALDDDHARGRSITRVGIHKSLDRKFPANGEIKVCMIPNRAGPTTTSAPQYKPPH